jgi:hypothetical protein
MLTRDLLLLVVGIGIVLIIVNFGFVALTRLPDSETDSTTVTIKFVRPFVFAIAQIFWIGICLGTVSITMLGVPGNPLSARYPDLESQVQALGKQPVDGPGLGAALLVIVLFNVGILGMIWMALLASRRLFKKTWDDPGDGVSRLLRTVDITTSYVMWPLLELIGIFIIVILFGNRLAHQIAIFPSLLAQARSGDLSQQPQTAFWLVVGMFALMLFTIGRFILNLIRQLRTLNWAITDGVISSSRIIKTVGSGTRPSTYYNFKTTYDYSNGGRNYEGDQVSLASQDTTYAWAWLLSKRFPTGSHVPVYYDPERPENAMLIRGVQVYPFLMGLLGSIFVLMILWVVFSLVLKVN